MVEIEERKTSTTPGAAFEKASLNPALRGLNNGVHFRVHNKWCNNFSEIQQRLQK
jgi:hypothetical protein